MKKRLIVCISIFLGLLSPILLYLPYCLNIYWPYGVIKPALTLTVAFPGFALICFVFKRNSRVLFSSLFAFNLGMALLCFNFREVMYYLDFHSLKGKFEITIQDGSLDWAEEPKRPVTVITRYPGASWPPQMMNEKKIFSPDQETFYFNVSRFGPWLPPFPQETPPLEPEYTQWYEARVLPRGNGYILAELWASSLWIPQESKNGKTAYFTLGVPPNEPRFGFKKIEVVRFFGIGGEDLITRGFEEESEILFQAFEPSYENDSKHFYLSGDGNIILYPVKDRSGDLYIFNLSGRSSGRTMSQKEFEKKKSEYVRLSDWWYKNGNSPDKSFKNQTSQTKDRTNN